MRNLRKFLLASLVCAIALGVLRAELARRLAVPAWDAFLLPFRIARMAAAPPDAVIRMPLLRLKVNQVAHTWHAARSGGRLHEGQDLFAPLNTPVYSATRGIVLREGNAGIGGNAVSILGPGGRVYYYAHLSRFAGGIGPGQEVTPDSVIGYVGTTGNARGTPPHLHFGVYSREGAVDPLPLLADRADGVPDRLGAASWKR